MSFEAGDGTDLIGQLTHKKEQEKEEGEKKAVQLQSRKHRPTSKLFHQSGKIGSHFTTPEK